MSELTLKLIQLGFLAVLWVFVLVAVSVMRSDLFGVKQRRAAAAAMPKAAPAPRTPRPPKPVKAPRPGKPGRGAPRALAVLEGPLAGQVIALGGELVVGRAPDSSVVLQDDYVSSRHARFFTQDGRWYVEDLGSTNGTQVSGTRITSPAPLHIGTTVRMGKTVLEVRK